MIGASIAPLACRTGDASNSLTQKREVRFHNWWNYYARAIAYRNEGKHEHAGRDFERALGLRPGAKFGFPQEHWRVRTYGLHFIDSYFPHRELGICLYRQGETERAIEFLERSLEQQPSARAKHFLNLCRRRLLQSATVDKPGIVLEDECNTTWTSLRQRTLRGAAMGPGFIRHISINEQRQYIELAQPVQAFDTLCPLKEGRNVLTVRAEDLTGRVVSTNVIWIADWQAPSLAVLSMERQADEWHVRGVCSDNMALSRVAIGSHVFLGPGDAPRRTVTIDFRSPDDMDLLFLAEDAAGNRLQMPLNPADATLALHPSPIQLAQGNTRATASDFNRAAPPSPAETPADTIGPSLRLSAPRDRLDVFSDEFFLDGRAGDGSGLASVTLRGEDLLAPELRGATRAYFSRRITLLPGTNLLHVTASDTRGNRTVRSVTVVRKTSEYLQNDYRLSVAVPPMATSAGDAIQQQFRRLLEVQLTRQPMRFRLLEREEGWESILQEHELSRSDLASPVAAIPIGKMLPAHLLLMVMAINEGTGYTMILRAVETGKGTVLAVDDVYSAPDYTSLAYHAEGLAMKLEQRFPLAGGKVQLCRRGKATVNVDTSTELARGAKLIVIEPTESGTLYSGRVKLIGGTPIEISVLRAEHNIVTGIIEPAAAIEHVRAGDYVYTR